VPLLPFGSSLLLISFVTTDHADMYAGVVISLLLACMAFCLQSLSIWVALNQVPGEAWSLHERHRWWFTWKTTLTRPISAIACAALCWATPYCIVLLVPLSLALSLAMHCIQVERIREQYTTPYSGTEL